MLYPPLIEGTLPSFYENILTVPFTMNKTVHQSEVCGFSLKIKTVQNNLQLGTITTKIFDFSSGVATFSLEENLIKKLNIGQYYKVQLAYIDEEDNIGYYSTVGVIKRTSKPKIYIDGLSSGVNNLKQMEYIGCYEQEIDFTEKVETYRFVVYDNNKNIVIDTGDLLHLKENDDESNKSHDSFILKKELLEEEKYYILYSITTNTGIKLSKAYKIIKGQLIDSGLKIDVLAELNYDNGYVKISLIEKEDDVLMNGSFLLSRKKVNDDSEWETLVYFTMLSKRPSSWSWKDFTIEHGVKYIYAIQQITTSIYSDRIKSNVVYADFEDLFLFDGEKQLKIKYNPKVSSFKTTILESKVETIGGKYPFIFKNGKVLYKDFPISGLISCLMDEEGLFIKDNFKEENLDGYTNLISKNLYKERKFKFEVLDWLNDGKPKIFRSPTEGNYIVRLMNTSLSPEDTLGRMLHSFSTTACEIGEYGHESLVKYGFIGDKEEFLILQRWNTIKLDDIYMNTNWTNDYSENILPQGIFAKNISFNNMSSGDKIKIYFKEELNPVEIIIGSTGSYHLDETKTIQAVCLHINNLPSPYGSITYSYDLQYVNSFGIYSNIKNISIPAKQFFGDMEETNLIKELEDIKTSVSKVHYIKLEKRPVYQVYAKTGSDVVIKDYMIDINNSNIYFDVECKNKVIWNDYNIYQIYLIDYQLDTFTNKDGKKELKHLSYIDGHSKHIFGEQYYSTKIKTDLSKDEIDIDKTTNYTIENPDIKEIFIGSGVLMTIGYEAIVKTYIFETDSSYKSKELKDNYDKSVRWYSALCDENNSAFNQESDLQITLNTIKEIRYPALIEQIELDLENYKKENDLL